MIAQSNDVLSLSPAYAAGVSAILLVTQLGFSFIRQLRLNATHNSEISCVPIPRHAGLSSWRYTMEAGGPVRFAFLAARLLGCIVLLALSLATLRLNKDPERRLVNAAASISYAYASILAIGSLLAGPKVRQLVTRHLVLLLGLVWGIFFYRNIWPLGTFTSSPEDLSEGPILWAKAVLLTLVAAVIPLSMPWKYTPVNASEPMEPNPEQTASPLSFVFYSFLDPLVFLANRVPHVSYDMLPPLADYDYAKNLVSASFQHLDPLASGGKRPHMLWGLLRAFRRDFLIMFVTLAVNLFTSFTSPLGLNRILYYLETGGEGAVVRPWVWILWLFLGPLLSSFTFDLYTWLGTRSLVRSQAIITQLIFEHALRIRMKAETHEPNPVATVISESSNAENTSTINPDNAEEPSSPSDEGTTETESTVATTPSAADKGKPVENIAVAPAKKADNLVGKINTLASADLRSIGGAVDFPVVFFYVPLQVVFSIGFLYAILGWSAFVGLAVIVLSFPLPGYVAKHTQRVQRARMAKMDARVQTVTETISIIRMIKLFGWETKSKSDIAEKREDELTWLWKRKMLDLVTKNLNGLIPIVTMIATYGTYTGLMKRELTASVVFSSMAVFDILRQSFSRFFSFLPSMIQAKVSIDRVDDFLTDTELLDAFTNTNPVELVPEDQYSRHEIGFRNAVFSWSNDSAGSPMPSKHRFLLRIKDRLLFKRGGINLIIGPTGSGKTSVLMALLGELHFIAHSPDSWYNLPRAGGVAYAAQESWVQNETIRENILFGAPYDEQRYNKVLHQCGLERDLALFDAGDRTEVGEKGLTLSGGQKARLTLARAVYSSAEILLLDDVLAALDVHTAKWIVDKCLKGDLLRGRTVILVTHNVSMLSSLAQFVVSVGVNGEVTGQESLLLDVQDESTSLSEFPEGTGTPASVEPVPVIEPVVVDAKGKSDGKLIVAEEVAEGHVTWSAFNLYTSVIGGKFSLFFWIVFLGGMIGAELLVALQTWFLGFWARQYSLHASSDVSVSYYLALFTLISLASLAIYSASLTLYTYGTLRASRVVHQRLINSVVGTTLRWLDKTPTSRIIARCTEDIFSVDGSVPQEMKDLMEMTIRMLTKFGAVVVLTPVFLVPSVAVAVLGAQIGQIYIRAQLSVKREVSNAKAPVLGHFGAAIAGLTSIRAYGAQTRVIEESLRRIDRYTRAARIIYGLNRWVAVRINNLGALLAAGLAAYIVYGPTSSLNASNTGFSLNMVIGFSSTILWWVRILNNFEVTGNSLERILGYVNIEQEAKPTAEGVPPAYWPASGDLRVENLSARYSPDSPEILHNLSFHIKSGERVGIVGRTGSGKSSLTLSLLRCIITEGNVYYDGLPTNSINLEALRSSITIIPQVPELLSGTLRHNLDPFSQYDDTTLNDALRAAGLKALQSLSSEGRITLDTSIADGGGNLSVGQRQIIALARAIVRGSKLLILDEATSAIDYKTDSIIQSSLRHELRGDITLLTVAHRLQTVMDSDKIIVLDAGHIVEFDSPAVLLQNEKGFLRSLVDESGDKDALYAMAAGTA